jgi:hypothetical protein
MPIGHAVWGMARRTEPESIDAAPGMVCYSLHRAYAAFSTIAGKGNAGTTTATDPQLSIEPRNIGGGKNTDRGR